MAHVREDSTKFNNMLCIHEKCCYFGLHGGSHDVLDNSGKYKDRGVKLLTVTATTVMETASLAACLRFNEVRCIRINVKDHVASMKHDLGVGVGTGIP